MAMEFLKQRICGGNPSDEGHYADERRRMVAEIVAMDVETSGYMPRQISEPVLSVMAKVPRHCFVPPGERYGAYHNRPLPIGHGQTISQPFIVALMTELLAPDKRDRVLEVGTGSGYQSAVLAELAGKVYSVEIVGPLAERSSALLKELGYANVQVKHGDGSNGWAEHAPFDGIIVAAAADHPPQPLLEQLKPGGRLVIPVGDWPYAQQLILITKGDDGVTRQQNILPVSFVPLTGGD